MTEQILMNRTNWVSALKTLPFNELLATTVELSADWTLRPKSIPQSGLGMLKIKECAFNEQFYVGEFCLSSAWLEVTTTDGQVAEGAAQVMDDRVELAEALALCDAILSAQLPGWENISSMIDRGLVIRESTNRERKQMLARTQVDFSLLDDANDKVGEHVSN